MLSVLTGQLMLQLLGSEIWEGAGIIRFPPPRPSFPLSFSLSPTASHSPLLLSLLSFARSSSSPTQLYSTGIEMGLSLPVASRRRGGGCQYYTAVHTHRHQTAADVSKKKKPPRNPHAAYFHDMKLLLVTISYRRWECSPCGPTRPPGSGRTRSSRVWSLPPPEGIAADTPGPGRSWATRIALRLGRPTEVPRRSDFPFRLF